MRMALTVGLVSTALAGTGVGARFDLGKTNVVNQMSKNECFVQIRTAAGTRSGLVQRWLVGH